MANYQNLKAAISAAIRTNGNQEITGQVLQDVLNSIVSVIGANYTFAGVATPATNPGTPDQNVMYLAMEGGTYTNFNGTVLPAGISLLMWNGSWRSETVMYGDGGVFDISVYKSSGGTLAMFADLAAALDGGNNIPASARKGGMSVKFVQSSDNKYVQFIYMLDDATIANFVNTANWQEAGTFNEKLRAEKSLENTIGMPQGNNIVPIMETEATQYPLDFTQITSTYGSVILGRNVNRTNVNSINVKRTSGYASAQFTIPLDSNNELTEGYIYINSDKNVKAYLSNQDGRPAAIILDGAKTVERAINISSKKYLKLTIEEDDVNITVLFWDSKPTYTIKESFIPKLSVLSNAIATNTEDIAKNSSNISILNGKFNHNVLESGIIIKGKNVNKSTAFTIVNDSTSYLLLIPQSILIYLFVDRSEFASNDYSICYVNRELTSISGMQVNEYNCVSRREPNNYPYIALPYPNTTTNPSLDIMEFNYSNNEKIRENLIPEKTDLSKRNDNLINISESFIDYRFLYGIIFQTNGYFVSNIFPIDITKKYCFNGYKNNNSGFILRLFDENGNTVGSEIPINTTNAFPEAKTFDWNDMELSKGFYVDLSTEVDQETYASAKYGFVAFKYNEKTGFDINNLYFAENKYLVSTTKEEIYQIEDKYAVKVRNPYYGKFFAAVGDSITAQGFYERFVRDILHLGGYTCNGVGGTRVSGSAAKAMWQSVRVNAIRDVDLITICGGVNDCAQNVSIGDITRDNYDTSTFAGAYNVLISKIYYRFLKLSSGYYANVDYTGVTQLDNVKDIRIVLLTPPKVFDNQYGYSRGKEFADAVKAIGELWGLPVCDLYGEANINDMNKTMFYSDSDRTHPQVAGHKMFADILIGKLRELNYFNIE